MPQRKLKFHLIIFLFITLALFACQPTPTQEPTASPDPILSTSTASSTPWFPTHVRPTLEPTFTAPAFTNFDLLPTLRPIDVDTPSPKEKQPPGFPTETPTALPPPYPVSRTPTVTSSPTSHIPTATPDDPRIIERVTPLCTRRPGFIACQDNLLHIKFEYPAIWGEFEGLLRTGDTGLLYFYRFDPQSEGEFTKPLAGGISENFSEGRGGIVTDFSGVEPGSLIDHCWFTPHGDFCRLINPDVLLRFYFFTAESLCNPGPGFGVIPPVAIIKINLRSQINSEVGGFVFAVPFLSASARAEYDERVAQLVGSSLHDPQCNPTGMDEFDLFMAELQEQMIDQALDWQTNDNVFRITHLANSIEFID